MTNKTVPLVLKHHFSVTNNKYGLIGDKIAKLNAMGMVLPGTILTISADKLF